MDRSLQCPKFVDDDFVKSSLSTWFPHNNCVAVARKDGVVAVRDTKDPAKTTLYFTDAEWQAFTAGVKNNEFNT